MSRCFPYPPPGFIEKKASDALIDSIKLQKEKKASKEQRKEKRKEKKEKKDKKREKKEKKGTFNPKPTEVVHGSQKDIKELLEFKEGHSLKRKLEDIEQLEGSSVVTEEHGQPLNLQNPSYSSDTTQNSNKRRKQAPSDSRGHGNIIRIKLPLQKHKEPESTVSKQLQNRESDVSASKELLCSIAGRTEIQKQQICSISGRSFSSDLSAQDVGTSGKEDSLRCGPTSGLGCSTSGKDEVVAQDDKRNKLEPFPRLCLTSREKKMLKKDVHYTNLVENLYQMAMPSQLADNDDEWLFGGKSVDKCLNNSVEKQFAVSTDVACSGSSSLYPCARYLKEAEIYALPYTVPF